jgi:hypothetical protein
MSELDDEKPITPRGMLHDFREHSDPWLIDQSRLFGLMTPSEQRELLFWMIMNNGIELQLLRGGSDGGRTAS